MQPVLDKLFTENSHALHKVKTWYLAPVDLENIKRDVLGISFVNSKTQQIARQSLSAIWIDSRIFNKMDERSQADLLIHELIMSLYFFRFESIENLCMKSALINNEDESKCHESIVNQFKYMAPEKVRPLTDEDNENIRSATAWLIQNSKNPITLFDFFKTLYQYNFDKRLFNPEALNPANKEANKINSIKVTQKELNDIINASQLGGSIPSICTDPNSDSNQSCKVTFSKSTFPVQKYYTNNKSDPNYNFEYESITMKIFLENKEPITLIGGIGNDIEIESTRLNPSEVVHRLVFRSYSFKNKVGDPTYIAMVMLKKDLNSFSNKFLISSISVTKGIITSIDKTRDPVCLTTGPQNSKPFDKGFIVHNSSKDSLKFEEVALHFTPNAFCTPFNIED